MRRVSNPDACANGTEDFRRGAKAKLPAAKLIDPLQHGAQSPGLSGLYSIVNGIRLALAHKYQFSDRELAELIAAGLRFFDGRLTTERVVMCGLPLGLWLRLAEALADRTRRHSRMNLLVEREYGQGKDRASSWVTIKRVIDEGRPLLSLVQGGRYTVVSGFTSSSLLLFDSSDAHWISKFATGVPGDHDYARHVVRPTSFISLRT